MSLTDEGILKVPGLLSRYVRLSTGVKVHYSTAGEDGPSVVLLHGGIPGSSGTAGFRLMAPFLGAQGFRVYAPDFPGFGLTEDPGNFYGYGQGAHVDFLQDFVNAVGLDTFHLAGNSMGCNNTVQYVLAHPERVTSFALIAGNVGDLVPRTEIDKLPKLVPDFSMPRFDGTEESMRASMVAVMHRKEAVDDDVVAMRTRAANNQPFYEENMARYQAAIRGTMGPDEAVRLRTKDRLNQITIPGIYLFGRQDVLIPVEGGYMQEDALPNIQFFYPDECGHQGQTDRPEVFNQTFLEFFRDGKVSWETAQAAGVSERRAPNPKLVGEPEFATP